MICPKCNHEMNPVNLERSVVECVKCRHRQHIYLPDLDVGKVRVDLNELTIGELPWAVRALFNESTEDEYDA